MNLNLSATTLRSTLPETLFQDSVIYSERDTALPGFAMPIERGILVNPNVIRAYQQVIFDLQIQVLHYRQLLEQRTRRTDPPEETTNLSQPINAVSIRIINSIVQARIPEDRILRALDDEEI